MILETEWGEKGLCGGGESAWGGLRMLTRRLVGANRRVSGTNRPVWWRQKGGLAALFRGVLRGCRQVVLV